jgi:hypothetical protein
MSNANRDDSITVNFEVEDWIETAEADISLRIDAAIEAKDAVAARDKIVDALKGILDVQWRFINLQKYTDSTGFERWQAVVQQRIAEKEINGMASRCKAVSKPGLQIRVSKVDYTPTKAELENKNAELRKMLYTRIGTELTSLFKAFGRVYRVGSVRFSAGQVSEALSPFEIATQYSGNSPKGGKFAAAASLEATNFGGGNNLGGEETAGGDDVTGFSVSRKVAMTAQAVLSVDVTA